MKSARVQWNNPSGCSNVAKSFLVEKLKATLTFLGSSSTTVSEGNQAAAEDDDNSSSFRYYDVIIEHLSHVWRVKHVQLNKYTIQCPIMTSYSWFYPKLYLHWYARILYLMTSQWKCMNRGIFFTLLIFQLFHPTQSNNQNNKLFLTFNLATNAFVI